MLLSDQQHIAISMLANGATHADIANKCGVDRRTVTRWRKHPAFAAQLEEACACVEEYAGHRMRALGAVALEQLAKMAVDPSTPATARVRILERLLEQSGLRPASRALDVGEMDEAAVIELVASLPPDLVAEAARRQGAA